MTPILLAEWAGAAFVALTLLVLLLAMVGALVSGTRERAAAKKATEATAHKHHTLAEARSKRAEN